MALLFLVILVLLILLPWVGIKLFTLSLNQAGKHCQSSSVQCPDCRTAVLYQPPYLLQFLTCAQIFLTPWVLSGAAILGIAYLSELPIPNPAATRVLALYAVCLLGRVMAFRCHRRAQRNPREICGCRPYGRAYHALPGRVARLMETVHLLPLWELARK